MIEENINNLKRALRIGVYSNLEAIVALIEATKIDVITLAKFLNNNTQEERLAVLGAVLLHFGDEEANVVRAAIDSVLNKKLSALRMSVRRNDYREFLSKTDRETLEEIAKIICSKGENKSKIEEFCLTLIDDEISFKEPSKDDVYSKLLKEGRICDVKESNKTLES